MASIREAVNIFALYYYTLLVALLFLLFLVHFSLNTLIFQKWYYYTDKYYEEKKISYMDKNIIIILDVILFLTTLVLDLLLFYFVGKASDYKFYTMIIYNHIKVSWTTSATFMDGVYLYKLILVILTSQYIFAILPPIILQIMKFVRRKQELIVNN